MKKDEILAEALKALRAGGTILYPTDTVWGLGCDATNPEAVAKVFAIKRRDEAKSWCCSLRTWTWLPNT